MFLRSFLFSGAALLLCSGALAQDAHVDFIPVPASGQLDEPTVAALGLARNEPQSAEAGATAQPADEAARQ